MSEALPQRKLPRPVEILTYRAADLHDVQVGLHQRGHRRLVCSLGGRWTEVADVFIGDDGAAEFADNERRRDLLMIDAEGQTLLESVAKVLADLRQERRVLIRVSNQGTPDLWSMGLDDPIQVQMPAGVGVE
jgi:hypothetical protein